MNLKRILIAGLIAGLLATAGLTAYAQVNKASANANRIRLVGTWFCDVAASDAGLPPFQALQTFHVDGTFIETSSLLGQGEEGPAHGVWTPRGNDYALAFQLFGFDKESGQAVIRVIVRVSIQLDGQDRLNAGYAVDLIDLDGTVTPNVDTGTYACTRMRVGDVP
jgi:hypothetical protein